MELVIKNSWLIIGIFMFFLSLIGNNKFIRLTTIVLFLVFAIIASYRGINFNDDTRNYVLHFTSLMESEFNFSQFFTWGWGIGYNGVVLFLTSILDNKFLILFFITIIPAIIFSVIFYKYKYHPSIIFFVYSTMLLVTTTSTMRHWWALSVSFLVLNHMIIDNKRSIKEYFYPMLFHYSTILLIFILFINSFKEKVKLQYLLLALTIILIIFIFYKNLIIILYDHFMDRAISGGVRVIGFRNLLNLILIFLILFSLKRMSLDLKKIDFLLSSSIIITIILMPFYGINRVASFFTLVILVYFNKYEKTYKINFSTFIISIISFMSLIYFYLYHKISS
jgi:hypothetical protein